LPGDATTEQLRPVPTPPCVHLATDAQDVVPRRRGPAVVEDLPPVGCSKEEMQLRPTLMVGIGGLAAATLRGVRRRVHERFGKLDALPAVGMLLLDTNRTALYQATQGDDGWAFQARETLALPLRRTQDYRRDSDKFLKWLSRRWLYNIPRSLETEGLRPLGRLAFVDHLDEVRQRLTTALRQVADPQATKRTSEAVGIEVTNASPRLVLVASICGGTGSGIVLDAAYAIRALARELGFPDAEVTGFLLHATSCQATARELAAVNAYACLNELYHYAQSPQGYAGDPGARLPATAKPPLDHPYVIHLGDDLDDERFARATDSVAAYLYRDVVSSAGPLLAKCRRQNDPADVASGHVRTLNVCQVGCANSGLSDLTVELLGRSLLDRWSGEGSGQPLLLIKERSAVNARGRQGGLFEPSDVARMSLECANTLDLELARLRKRMDELVEGGLGKPPTAHIGALVQQFLAQHEALHGDESPLAVDQFIETLDRLLGPRGEQAQLPAPSTPLEKGLVKHVEALAEGRGGVLVDWLHQTSNSPKAGVQGAVKAAEWFVQHLRGLEKESREAAQTQRQEAAAFEQILRGAQITESRATMLGLGRTKKAGGVLCHRADILTQMALRRFGELSLRCVIRFVQTMAQRINSVFDGLRNLRRALGTLAESFSPGPPLQPDENVVGLASVHLSVGRSLQARLDDLVDQLADRLSGEVLGDRGMRAVLEQPELLQNLATHIRHAARHTVRGALGKVDLAGWLLEDTENRLKEVVDQAQPRLLTKCGGARRIVVCQPATEGGDRLGHAIRETFRLEPMLVVGDDPDLVICCEAERIPLDSIADALTEEWIELPQMASRVRTRIDVTWTPLPG
jgi:hypothetical protein